MRKLANRVSSFGSVAFAASLVLMSAACDGAGSVTGPDDTTKPETPVTPSAGPFFHGAFLGEADSKPERIGAAIREYGDMVGKAPALVKTYHPVSCDFSAAGWCGKVLREVSAAGATNFLALDLRWSGAPQSGLLEAIAAGRADAEFARIGRQLAAVGTTVLLEPAWEMNGNWQYVWQGVQNGGDHSAPAKYAAAWRRIVDIFRREGASNVRWVFNPNVGNPLTNRATGPAHWNWYGHYYPGDAYVDYVGAHGFNAPRLHGGSWQEFDAMVDGVEADHMLSDLASRYPGKPIIIGEVASDEGTGDAKARWIRGAFAHMRRHPAVVGAVWFHMNKEADWRVNSSAASLQAYRDAVRDAGVLASYSDVSSIRPTMLASN